MPLFHGGYAIPMRSQFSCHISRATKQLWHSSQYQFIIIVICCIMALLCGWIVHGVDLEDTTNLRTIVSIVFFSIGVISNLSFQAALSFYFSERPAFYREQSSHMYHPLPWGFAYLLAELPYSIFLTFLYVLIFYVSVELILIVNILFKFYFENVLMCILNLFYLSIVYGWIIYEIGINYPVLFRSVLLIK